MKRRIATLAAALITGAAVLVGAPTASADNCRESLWGDDLYGNKSFDCSDGSYTLKKPFGSSWDDSISTYEFEGDSNSYSGKCTYSYLTGGYKCKGDYKDSYGSNRGGSYGSNSYGSRGFGNNSRGSLSSPGSLSGGNSFWD